MSSLVPLSRLVPLVGGVVSSLVITSTLLAAAAPATNTLPGSATAAKSTFDDNPRQGKDPFFPNSKRRLGPGPVVTVSTNTSTPTVVTDYTRLLFLKGIYGKYVMINNVDFAMDEEKNIKFPNGSVKVKCVEIREKSVLVEVNGKQPPVELKIREGIL